MCTQKSYTKILADNRGVDQIRCRPKQCSDKNIVYTKNLYKKSFENHRGADPNSAVK